MTLIVALSLEDKEVLTYLLSCSSTNFSNNHRKETHKTTNAAAATFGCAKIIDAYEDNLLMQNKKDKSKRERKKGKSTRGSGQGSEVSKKSEFSLIKNDFDESNSVSDSTSASGTEEDDRQKEELEKGSMRNL
ncbi:Uncharacterized protein Adt_44504 [Abeliophyllum distichum]|uniref:Uncharacterized protein n=1 Tax=Abeliophyllum distichum TaxID=126358 RepID=A0ABD1PBS0_9LAMI